MHRSLATLLLVASISAADSAPPAPASDVCGVDGGRLRARLRGAIDAEIDWRGAALECDGMLRPAGAGVRARFRGRLPDGRTIALVFGVPTLAPGEDRGDLPVNVTLIVEGAGGIFGTLGGDRCRLDAVRQREIGERAVDGVRRYRIDARGYCTAPAAAINGGDGVLLNRFDFVGLVQVQPEDPSAPAEAGLP